jgi:glucose/arabinose dehydrogenase
MSPQRPSVPRRLLLSLAIAASTVLACGPGTTAPPSGVPPSAQASATPTTSPDATATPPATPAGSLAEGSISLASVVTGLASPLDIATTDDGTGRIYVAEQGGTVRIVDGTQLLPTPFLDISDKTDGGGERGLLGIAFHPRVFVDYTDLDGNTVVSSFDVGLDADAVDPDSERIILQVEQPYANHNGGALAFGPDGMLYIALGDGGSGGDPQGNGQRLDTLLAKILRIDVDTAPGSEAAYTIPDDNPYADGAAGAMPETWVSGLRNPWRMRFDPPTGDLWIGDVGQGAYEEIDVVRAGTKGQDFGWNIMEGFHCYNADSCDQSGLTLPVADYDHSLGCAVIGGVVVHDAALGALDGRYLFSDDCSGNVWAIDPGGDDRKEPTLVLDSGRSISSIGAGDDGTVYLTDLGGGELLKVTTSAS